jgi:hypothetical protein
MHLRKDRFIISQCLPKRHGTNRFNSRDNGPPYSTWLAYVDKKSNVPVNAILMTFTFTCCMSLINLSRGCLRGNAQPGYRRTHGYLSHVNRLCAPQATPRRGASVGSLVSWSVWTGRQCCCVAVHQLVGKSITRLLAFVISQFMTYSFSGHSGRLPTTSTALHSTGHVHCFSYSLAVRSWRTAFTAKMPTKDQ